jgi:hypothetical protein
MLTYVEISNDRKRMILCADNSKHINHAHAPKRLDTPDGLPVHAAREIVAGEEFTCNYFVFDLDAARKLDRDQVRGGV